MTKRTQTSDRTLACNWRKRQFCDDGGRSLACKMGRCRDISEPDVQLLAQSNDDRCNRSTMPMISTLGRVRRRAEQVHAQSRGESYHAPRPRHLVRLSILKAKSASCNNCICRI